MRSPLLIQMSGCPGAGKSTIGRAIGRRIGAAVLDHDVIKSALLANDVPFNVAGKAAYQTAHALARFMLAQGQSVVLDSPCVYDVLLANGMKLATELGAGYRYVECVTDDLDEIRRRLRAREPLPSQCVSLDPAPGDVTRRAQIASGEELFRDWIRNAKRPDHSYLRVDTSRSVATCLAEVFTFLEEPYHGPCPIRDAQSRGASGRHSGGLMQYLQDVHVAPEPLDRFQPLMGKEYVRQAEAVAARTARRLAGRVWWNVNSTARGGGVAEMLPPLLAYARGAGIDVRWLVITGTPEFFQVTKRLHHALHGSPGDGSPLGTAERAVYESALAANAEELLGLVRPDDVVLLHDPQTAGLAPVLVRHGVTVIWRCHVGADAPNAETERGWEFLAPYLTDVAATVFSRQAYIPAWCNFPQPVVVPPSIDPFSPKNQDLDASAVRAMLVHVGLVEGPAGNGAPAFRREDGSPGRVDRLADVVRYGPAPAWETPLVVQVSRWDPLKDPLGVMAGFAALADGAGPASPALVLAGPNVRAVTDDPEGAATFDAVVATWRELPPAIRGRIHLASLPMDDAEENAAIVNALQRHAAVVVQKSLREGFGLTVTEAMWKGRPVVASRIGGIQDQIVDGEHGLLIEPTDLAGFAAAVRRVLDDPALAARLGAAARQRVQEEYLGIRHLIQYAELLERVDTHTG